MEEGRNEQRCFRGSAEHETFKLTKHRQAANPDAAKSLAPISLEWAKAA